MGNIFSVFGIKKLLKETECESLICPIQSYDQFMNTIKVAIQNNLPIIIPYNNIINHNSNKMSGENLHWATIIGIIDTSTLQSILLASHNCYESLDAQKLYQAFFNTPTTFPGIFHYKKKNKPVSHYISSSCIQYNLNNYEKKYEPKKSLNNFRRKLIIVFPPKAKDQAIEWHEIIRPRKRTRSSLE